MNQQVLIPELRIRRLCEDAVLPQYMTPGAAAFDLYIPRKRDYMLSPHETVMIGLGFATSFPPEFVAHMYARSGLGAKGIGLANHVAVIDSDYRGEWVVAMHNNTEHLTRLTGGYRIAQCVIHHRPLVNIVEVVELDTTARAEGGFGSTGS